ncbi:transposase [Tateyamaria sp.]|uniref:transposase n=1 Tax=Tateyamaria sp. TaxID=1929288 RepID=UPI00329F7D67
MSISLSPSSYSSFGRTAKGDPRYQCKACKKTFSTGKPTRRHKSTDDTGAILKCLVNKVPLSSICEIHDVSLKQIHSKVDFLYRQAVAFSHEREKRLDACFAGRNPVFTTDIQTILVNWAVKKRRGSIPLLHMATVHKFSQFVVAATVDYDADVSPEDLESVMTNCGDFDLPRSMRKNARLWSATEYQGSLMRSQGARFSKDDIATAGKLRLPGHGSRVRGDAFKFAHMMHVKKLIGERFRTANYCLDDEAGLAAAVCALNVENIKSGRVNVAEISFRKGMINDDRQALATQGRAALTNAIAAEETNMARVKTEFPHLSDFQAITLILLWKNYRNLSAADRAAKLANLGVPWPFHTKSEPYKFIRLKTDLDDMGWDGLAKFFANATIHPVDAYFNLARRRVTGFERGIPTATNDKRIWHAYSYYNPEMVPKMAAILRFYYNYMLVPRDGDSKTPAMRLGLAKGKIYVRDLLAYS